MFVSEYTTYIQHSQPTKRLYETQENSSSKKTGEFTKQLEAFEIFQTPKTQTKRLPIDYQHTTNYYANRYKLNYEKEQPKELQQFQKQQIQVNLPKTYNTVFTSLYEIVQPKKALIQPQQTPTQNSEYDALKKLTKQKEMAQTYSANDAYYRRTYAS